MARALAKPSCQSEQDRTGQEPPGVALVGAAGVHGTIGPVQRRCSAGHPVCYPDSRKVVRGSREVFEYALAHSLPDKVEAAYRRGDLLEKRIMLMQA